LCEKKFPKSAKIGKNQKKCKKLNVTKPIGYNELKAAGSNPAGRTNDFKGL